MCKAVCVVHLCQVVLTNYFLGLLFSRCGCHVGDDRLATQGEYKVHLLEYCACVQY